MESLKKSGDPGPKGPVVLAIMDGIGIGKYRGRRRAPALTRKWIGWRSTLSAAG